MDFARWTLLAACAVSLAWAEDEAPSPGGVETLDSVAKTIFDALQSGDMKRMSPLLPLTADIEWLSKQPDAVSFDDESAEATATRYRRATLNMVRVARADSRLDWSKAVLTGLTRTDIYGDQGTLSFGLAAGTKFGECALEVARVPRGWIAFGVALGQKREELILPVASSAKEEAKATRTVTAWVKRGGIVTLGGRGDAPGNACSLEELGKTVGFIAERKGGSVVIRLRADKNTPWEHIQWVLAVLKDEHVSAHDLVAKTGMDLSYTSEEATHLGQVWKDPPTRATEGVLRWWSREAKDDLRSKKITVALFPASEVSRTWAMSSQTVRMPRTVRYEVNGQRTSDLAELRRVLAALAKASDDGADGSIEARDPRIPYKFVLAVADAFRAAGVERIGFAQSATAPKAILRLPYLPYPKPRDDR